MDKVFCYWDECNVTDHSQWILERWRDNWSSMGFVPIVVGPNDATRHPRHDQFMDLFRSFPTVNPKRYEAACFARWLVMAQLGGLMVDADVFNIGFDPFEVRGLQFFDHNRVPCAVAGRAQDFASVLAWFQEFRIDVQHNEGGRPHVSDMTICTSHNEAPTLDLVREVGENKPYAKLIHFSCASCATVGGKRAAIERFLSET